MVMLHDFRYNDHPTRAVPGGEMTRTVAIHTSDHTLRIKKYTQHLSGSLAVPPPVEYARDSLLTDRVINAALRPRSFCPPLCAHSPPCAHAECSRSTSCVGRLALRLGTAKMRRHQRITSVLFLALLNERERKWRWLHSRLRALPSALALVPQPVPHVPDEQGFRLLELQSDTTTAQGFMRGSVDNSRGRITAQRGFHTCRNPSLECHRRG